MASPPTTQSHLLVLLVQCLVLCHYAVLGMDAPCYHDTANLTGLGVRALIITTSHDKLGDENCSSCKPTGVYGEEFTTPYYKFLDAGCSVTLMSIRGGKIPVDPTYNSTLIRSRSDKRFWQDPVAQQKASHTMAISDPAADFRMYDIVFMAGGWGAAWDLGTSIELGEKISRVFANETQFLGSVCHGALGLILAKKKGWFASGQWNAVYGRHRQAD